MTDRDRFDMIINKIDKEKLYKGSAIAVSR